MGKTVETNFVFVYFEVERKHVEHEANKIL